jgi:hypothetical protein
MPLQQARQLKEGMEAAGRTGTEGYEQACRIEEEAIGLLEDHRLQLVQVGAPGRLLIAGELDQVLPLDDAGLLEKAKPVAPDGRQQENAEAERAREDAIVRRALRSGPVAFIVLGGAHDLSGSIRRAAGGRCEYLRVTTSWAKHLLEEGR